MARNIRRPLLALVGTMVALASFSAESAELRAKISDTCPYAAPLQGDEILAALGIALGTAVVTKLAGGVIDSAVSYIKDDTTVTKTGYVRVPHLLADAPEDSAPSKDADGPKLNPAVSCIYGMVGDFGNTKAATTAVARPPELSSAAWNRLAREFPQVTALNLYFEISVARSNKTKSPVFFFKPRTVYYLDTIQDGGVFPRKHDLGISIDMTKYNEKDAFASSTLTLEKLKSGPDTFMTDDYFEGRDLPWSSLPAADKDVALNVKITVIETGKANTLDKAVGQALADQKDSIVKAIQDGISQAAGEKAAK